MYPKILLINIFIVLLSTELVAMDVQFSPSILVWEAKEEGLELAIDNKIGSSSITDGTMEYLPRHWDWGFRLGVDACLPCLGLNGELAWTHFSSCSSWHKKADDSGGLFSIWTTPCASITAETKGSAKWDIQLDLVNLEFSKSFCPACCLELHPHLGLVAGSIDQTLHLHFSGGVGKGISALVLDDAIRMRNDYKGVGLRGGINGFWNWMCGMKLYGKCACSVLYGCFDNRQKETIDFEGVNDPSVALNLKDSFHRTKVFTELSLGISKTWQCFTLELEWDQLFFIGQNQLKRFVALQDPGINTSSNGDLTFQGFSLKGSFSF